MRLEEWLSNNPLPALCERGYEGVRVFLFKSGEHLAIATTRGVFTPGNSPKFFSRVTEFVHAPHRMILDGEYVPKEGVFLFDIIQVDDRDLRDLPLEKRREILEEILDGTGLIVPTRIARSVEEIRAVRAKLASEQQSGLVVKNPKSKYGELNAWLAMKRPGTIDCFVTKVKGIEKTGKEWSAGIFDDRGSVVDLGTIYSFGDRVDSASVREGSVVSVRFKEITSETKLVQPFIIKVRHHKPPSECQLSQIIV